MYLPIYYTTEGVPTCKAGSHMLYAVCAWGRLRKDEVDRAEKRVQEVTGWSDPVEEKTGFFEAACQNYEALVEGKRVGKTGGAGPS